MLGSSDPAMPVLITASAENEVISTWAHNAAFPYTRIGIIGAMQVEIDLLIQTMERQGTVSMSSIAGRDFYEGNLNGTPVVVVQCGVGMVNAALCAQVLFTSFSADAVINTGIAGSLDPSIDIGDVVLSTDSVNHIMDVQNLGYEPGQTPGIKVVAYPASETLRNTAKTAAQSWAALASNVG